MNDLKCCQCDDGLSLIKKQLLFSLTNIWIFLLLEQKNETEADVCFLDGPFDIRKMVCGSSGWFVPT